MKLLTPWIDGAPLILTNGGKNVDEFELGEGIEEKNGDELELLGQFPVSITGTCPRTKGRFSLYHLLLARGARAHHHFSPLSPPRSRIHPYFFHDLSRLRAPHLSKGSKSMSSRPLIL